MEFKEISDEQWQFIQPLLPPKARTGRPRADDRKMIGRPSMEFCLFCSLAVVGRTCLIDMV